jgi:hypothetical protein
VFVLLLLIDFADLTDLGALGALAPAGRHRIGSVGVDVGMAVVVGAAEIDGANVGLAVVGIALGERVGVLVGVAVVGVAVGLLVGVPAASSRDK